MNSNYAFHGLFKQLSWMEDLHFLAHSHLLLAFIFLLLHLNPLTLNHIEKPTHLMKYVPYVKMQECTSSLYNLL